MKRIVVDLPNNVDEIKIIPISDVHIGDRTMNMKLLKETLDKIKNEPNTYTIINGDICNIGLKDSKTDVYLEEMSPMEQLNYAITLLEPIKSKILVLANGNHESRITKNTNIDILYLLAKQLGIEDRYAPSWWYLYLSFGKNYNSKKKPFLFIITGYHGSGGGRKSGSKINRLEEMSQVVIADLYIMSHVHKTIGTKGVIFVPDVQHKTMVKKDLYYLITNSFVEYEGSYGETMGLIPSNTSINEAILSGKGKKEIKLIL